MAGGSRSAGSRSDPAGGGPSSSHLARLIEAESAFEARLAGAREEAERIVGAARDEAASGAPSARELEAESARLRAVIARETEARLAAIEADRRAQAECWRHDDAIVARLARAALDRLLEPLARGGP